MQIDYRSTRGFGPVSFERTLLEAVAPDGGLYTPMQYPKFSYEELEKFSFMSYEEVAEAVLSRFVDGMLKPHELKKIIRNAYGSWGDPEVAPLQQYDSNTWLMELYYGPSWSFKDFPLQLMAHFLPKVTNKPVTFIMSSTGDLGAAAVSAFANVENVRLVLLYPEHTSRVHRAQMNTSRASNVYPIAVQGTYEDCQKLVGSVLGDEGLREKGGFMPTSSWIRIAAQSVYFFFAWSRMRDLVGGQAVQFSIPTGNFTNAFACYVAMQCGLPVEKIIVANNDNDVVSRFINDNDYSLRNIKSTKSPCIDAMHARNVERLLFDLYGKDASKVSQAMGVLSEAGQLPPLNAASFVDLQGVFAAERISENEMFCEISEADAAKGLVIDPHTAIALAAAKKHSEKPSIVLSTASAVKFASTVQMATAKQMLFEDEVEDLLKAEAKEYSLSNDADALRDFIEDNLL